MWFYMAVVVLHWVEHISRAAQIWIMGMLRPESLAPSEWRHPGW